MSYLLEEELALQGVSTKTTLKIRFNNKVYVRVKTLPLKFYERAKKIKEEYSAKNLDTLLIEHKSWIAIWIEQLSRLSELDNNFCYRVQDLSPNFENSSSPVIDVEGVSYDDYQNSFASQELDRKPVTKKYRGVTYEESVSENSNLPERSQQSTRRYRGISYHNETSENQASANKSSTIDSDTQAKPSKRRYRGRFY